MSFSSSTVLNLSSGNVPGGQTMTSSPAVEEGGINYNYAPIPGYRRQRSRPASRPGATVGEYGSLPGAGQFYGSPKTSQPPSGGQNQSQGQGQRYGQGQGQNYGQSYSTGTPQNVGQSYGRGSYDNQNYGGQAYDNPDVGQTYGQSYGQNYGAQTIEQNNDYNRSQGYEPSYPQTNVDQSYGSNQPASPGSYMADYGLGPQQRYDQQPQQQQQQPPQQQLQQQQQQQRTSTYSMQPAQQSQKASIEVSNEGYKPPGGGGGQAPAQPVTSNIRTVSGAVLGLSPDVIARYKRKFNHMDLNKDGILTMREFMTVSRVFGYKLTPEEMSQIFGKRDLDDSGGITFDEFVTAMEERARKQKALQPIRDQFRYFDVKSRGYLTADDVHPKLERELGFDMNKTESFVDMYDKNKDYVISLFEFVDFYKAFQKLKGEIEQAFRDFDRNADGFVDIFELNSKLAPKGFSEEEVETLMRKYDKDCDNKLSYQEFAAFWDVPIF